jgi:hypothetical protein
MGGGEYMADLQAVQDVCRSVEEKLGQASKECYCAENACDHKGPCNPCLYRGMLRELKDLGRSVLAIDDPIVFDDKAEEFLRNAARQFSSVW